MSSLRAKILPSGVRGRLVLLILFALLPLIALQVWDYYDRYRYTVRNAQLSELELARSVGHDFETFLFNLERQEGLIGQALAAFGAGGGARATRLLEKNLAEFASVRTLSWINRDGTDVHAAGTDARSVRPRLVQALTQFVGSGQQKLVTPLRRIDGQAGFRFYVMRAIRDADGRLRGMVEAEVDPDLFGRRALPLRRTAGGVFALFDPNGWVAYRSPPGEVTDEGRMNWLEGDVLLQRTLRTGREQAGSLRMRLGAHSEWISARTPLPSGWVMGSAQPRQLALAHFFTAMRRDALLMLLFDAIVFAFALRIAQTISGPIVRLAEEARGTRATAGEDVEYPPAAREVADLRLAMREATQGLERRQGELEQAVNARDEVLAVVSHDLRNPLTAIRMNAELLAKPGGLDAASMATATERIRRAAENMDRLIQDLLDVTRIERAGLSLERRPEAVSPVVDEAVDMLRPLAAAKAIRLDYRKAPIACCPVSFDRRRLVQVLSNLIGNAVKFTPEGGNITVTLVEEPDRVSFSVTDSGPGIPEDERPRIFDRFWQSGRVASAGVGLGLFITRGIVEGHGGRIWVESEVGHGSTFRFELPIAPSGYDACSRVSA